MFILNSIIISILIMLIIILIPTYFKNKREKYFQLLIKDKCAKQSSKPFQLELFNQLSQNHFEIECSAAFGLCHYYLMSKLVAPSVGARYYQIIVQLPFSMKNISSDFYLVSITTHQHFFINQSVWKSSVVLHNAELFFTSDVSENVEIPEPLCKLVQEDDINIMYYQGSLTFFKQNALINEADLNRYMVHIEEYNVM